MDQLHWRSWMESLGTSPERNGGCDGRPWSEAAHSQAAAPATLTKKWTMKKEEKNYSKTCDESAARMFYHYARVTQLSRRKYRNGSELLATACLISPIWPTDVPLQKRLRLLFDRLADQRACWHQNAVVLPVLFVRTLRVSVKHGVSNHGQKQCRSRACQPLTSSEVALVAVGKYRKPKKIVDQFFSSSTCKHVSENK